MKEWLHNDLTWFSVDKGLAQTGKPSTKIRKYLIWVVHWRPVMWEKWTIGYKITEPFGLVVVIADHKMAILKLSHVIF